MCCRTQLGPMRQVGQVGATRTTSVGLRDAELNTLRSSWMLFSCGGAAAAFAPLPPWLACPPQPAASDNRAAASAIVLHNLLRGLIIPALSPSSGPTGAGVGASRGSLRVRLPPPRPR